jgi:hypothetical protein
MPCQFARPLAYERIYSIWPHEIFVKWGIWQKTEKNMIYKSLRCNIRKL